MLSPVKGWSRSQTLPESADDQPPTSYTTSWDTTLSCFKADFVAPQQFAYDLAELGHYFRDYRRLMDHWHAVLPGRMLDVGYEALIANQEGETRKLLDYCGLAWEDACLSIHATERPVLTASNAQVRKHIYRDSIDRWRRYERHLGSFLDVLGPLAERRGAD